MMIKAIFSVIGALFRREDTPAKERRAHTDTVEGRVVSVEEMIRIIEKDLTQEEKKLLVTVAQPYDMADMCNILGIDPDTLRTRRAALYSKVRNALARNNIVMTQEIRSYLARLFARS